MRRGCGWAARAYDRLVVYRGELGLVSWDDVIDDLLRRAERVTMKPVEAARAVADAVLYEGYVLYPYRATSSKNLVRWQWGVLMPEDVVALDGSERSGQRTDVVVDGAEPTLRVTVRFLQVQRRRTWRTDSAAGRAPRGRGRDYRRRGTRRASRRHTVEVPMDRPLDTTVHVTGRCETEELLAR